MILSFAYQETTPYIILVYGVVFLILDTKVKLNITREHNRYVKINNRMAALFDNQRRLMTSINVLAATIRKPTHTRHKKIDIAEFKDNLWED